jgi:hypothetical protein
MKQMEALKIPMMVFNMDVPGILLKLVMGEPVGTFINNDNSK